MRKAVSDLLMNISMQLLGALVEDSAVIRSAARRILWLTTLQKLSIFKLCFEGLIRNLELYPQVI